MHSFKRLHKDEIVQMLGILIIFSLIIYSFRQFSRQSFEHTYADSKKRLAEVAEQNIDAMRIEFEKALEYVESVAVGFAHIGDVQSRESLELLLRMHDAGGFSRMWMIDRDGVAHSAAGEAPNASFRPHIENAWTGRGGIAGVARSSFNDKPVFCVYAPVVRNGECLGIVLGAYEMESMVVRADNPQFERNGYVHVFDADGNLVIHSRHENSVMDVDNMHDFLRRVTFGDGHDYDTLRRGLAEGDSGIVDYAYKGRERISYYAPVGFNGWYIFASAPKRIFSAFSDRLDDLAADLVLKILGCFLALVAGIGYYAEKSTSRLVKANERLAVSNKRFHFAARTLAAGLLEYDVRANVLSRISETFRGGDLEVVGDPATGLIPGERVDDQHVPQIAHALAGLRAGSKTETVVVSSRTAAGDQRWYKINFANIFLDDGQPVEAIGMVENITKLKEKETLLARRERHRQVMLSDAVESFVFNITKGRYLYGFCPSDAEERKFDTLYISKLERFIDNNVHPESREAVLAALSEEYLKERHAQGAVRVEEEFRSQDDATGETWMKITTNLAPDSDTGDLMGYSSVEDITREKRERLALRRDAERDALTGLYNRNTANVRIENALEARQNGRRKRLDAFFMIDLDRFKHVNDTYGHAAGDEVLQGMAAGLTGIFRESDIVGRMGGDEFVAYMTGAKSPAVITARAESICRALKTISFAADPDHRISGSVGVMIVDGESPNLKELYENADNALYAAKHAGKDCYRIFKSRR